MSRGEKVVMDRAIMDNIRAKLIAIGCAALVAVMAATASDAVTRVGVELAPDSLLAGGQRVLGYEFAGARARSPLALERVLEQEARGGAAGRTWDGRMLNRALTAILTAYRDLGHLRAAITAVEVIEAADGVRLRFVIDEGPAVLLGAVDIVGNDLHSDAEIRELLGLREGQPFVAAAFQEGVERLLLRYENEGRPFANVEPRNLVWGDQVRFTVAVHEGSPVQVDAVRVKGNRVTREEVVKRISGLEPGQPFVQARLATAEARLRRSGLFAQVEPVELAQGVDRTRHELLVRVREGRTNTVNGAVGYGGPEQGMTGLFDLALGNLAGTARRASARWEGRGRGVALYQLRYSEPWILGSPVTGHVGVWRGIQDTLYTRTSFSVAGEVELMRELRLTAGWERETTVQSAGSVRGTERNALLAGVAWDTRDSRLNPTRGLRVAGDVRLARKVLHPRAPEEADTQAGATLASGEIERAQPIGRRWVAIARARGAGIISEEDVIPFYELYPLGGALSLRGYREEHFRGSSTVLVQFEQRFLLDTDGSRLVGFVDVGQVSTSGTALAVPGEPTRHVMIGYGAGLRVATRIGLVGLDYGLGEGDGPLDGKLHFGLEAAF
jgi:outer membrane protein assembly factor BamA